MQAPLVDEHFIAILVEVGGVCGVETTHVDLHVVALAACLNRYRCSRW